MVEPVVQWWRNLAVRERRWVAVGGVFLSAVLLYAVAFEPAWRGRRAVLAELPGLRADLARMQAMAEEVRRLVGASGQAAESAARVRGLLEASLAAAGLSGHVSALTVNGELIDIRLSQAPAHTWLAWLDQALRETRWRVVDLVVEREVQPGRVAVRMTLEGGKRP